MDNWEKSGKIAAQALEYGAKLIKINEDVKDVCEKVEAKIIELGGKPAFPVQISINDIAAHFTPQDEIIKFKENDIAKLDVGAHVEGYIGDNAVTIDLGDNTDLVKASKLALQEAIKIIRPGTKLFEIGKIVEKTITEFGFKPIRNLSGHGIDVYEEHSGFTIPNYNNEDDTELKENQIIAIEPFATDGMGMVQDGKLSGIYKVVNAKQVRNDTTRNMLKFILQEYNTLPFAKRWLLKKFPSFNVNFALRMLEKDGILHHYSQLSEKSHGLVSQHEFTLLVKDKPKILTKVD
ncbi:MAG: type II methionyl aminopeptidase [Nanoarchaeota archaeon]